MEKPHNKCLMKYEHTVCYCSKILANLTLKTLDMKVKGHSQCHLVKHVGMNSNDLLQGMWIWNMKTFTQTVLKLW